MMPTPRAHPLASLAGCPFRVMDGAGNDFVIVDMRAGGRMTEAAARFLGDRLGPYGCDQVIGITEGPFMQIWNADGSPAGACGNAARCVADILMEEAGSADMRFGSPAGVLAASRDARGMVTVDMGSPRWSWEEIPLSRPVAETRALPLPADLLAAHGLDAPVGISMGNPHAVFFVADAEAIALDRLGPRVETDPLFPGRANVTVASPRGGGFRTRTWERGVGITRACGTAACATLVAAVRTGRKERSAAIEADGGRLAISWDAGSGRVLMAGPVRLHRLGTL